MSASISKNRFFDSLRRMKRDRVSTLIKKQRRSLVLERLEQRDLFAALTPGNILVVQAGDGTAALSSSAAGITLKEYTPSGAFIQTITVDSTAGSSGFTLRGTSTTEGTLSISPDGSLVTFVGHRAAAGTSNPNNQSVDRVIGKLPVSTGVVNTSQGVAGIFSADSARSVVTNDGSAFWLSGAGSGTTGGVQYVASGTATTGINLGGTNSRSVQIAGGNLYVSGGAANPGRSVFQVGSGLPTTTPQAFVSSFPLDANSQFQSYYFADLSASVGWNGSAIDTIYVTNTVGGTGVTANLNLFKFSFDGSAWNATGTVTLAALQNITGFTTGSSVQLWGTTSAAGGTVQTLTDTSGYNGTLTATFAPLATPVTADTNTAFRGIVRIGASQILPPPVSVISVGATSSTSAEGNSGSTPFTFTVNRTGVTTGTSTVQWAVTGSGTNPANAADFQGNALPSGTITFAPNDTTPQTITVNVAGDSIVELDEGFTITLSNPNTDTVLGSATALGSILNDDVVQSLAPGDIVLTGMNGTNPDQFSFVPLVDLAAGTEIKFTDNAWTGSALTTNEGFVTFTVGAGGITAGTKLVADLVVQTIPTVTPSLGTISSTTGFGLNASGENLFVFQKAFTSPQFVYGLTTSPAFLTTGSTTTANSFLPSSLSEGTTAVQALGVPASVANAAYNDAVIVGTASELRAAIGQRTNWITAATGATAGLPLSTANLTVQTAITPASIVGRNVFYNNTTFFGTGGANAADPLVNPVNAIDPTKSALLPGGTATVANFTNYSRGINGLVIDLTNPANLSAIDASSFQFATWSDFTGTTPNFVTITPAVTVSTFATGGQGGSARVKLTFADRAIENSWLRVTVLANPLTTGLSANDVFYFGNARFDVNATNATVQVGVNILDTNQVRGQNGLNSGVVSNVFDVDRSGAVNVLDTNAVRGVSGFNSLRFFNAPAGLQLARSASFATPAISSPNLNLNKRMLTVATDAFFSNF
ncbi:MAG: hypothetical protein NTW52_09580 [Planctomycetota bacterium]|nr:hypothetical protein [Planctomycetota bacterium]